MKAISILNGLMILFISINVLTSDSLADGKGVSYGSTAINSTQNNSSVPVVPYAAGVTTPVRPNSTAQQMADAFQDPNYDACGQDCLYNKANENITIQMQYILQKYAALEDASLDEQIKMKLLGSFCGKANGQGSSDESFKDCKDRYIKVNKFWILKARGSVGSNEGAIAKLRCNQFGANGECLSNLLGATTIEPGHDPSIAQKQLQLQYTHISKSGDLGLESRNQAGAGLQGVRDNAQWENDAYASLEPKQEDFVKFRKIPDPGNAGQQLEIPVMNGNKLVYDKEAYQAAKDEWSGKSVQSRSSSGNSAPNLVQTRASLKDALHGSTEGQRLNQVVKDDQKAFQAGFSKTVTPDQVKSSPDLLNRYIYDQARGQIVNVKGKSAQKANFQAPQGGYTGLETITPPTAQTRTSLTVRLEAGQIGVSSNLSKPQSQGTSGNAIPSSTNGGAPAANGGNSPVSPISFNPPPASGGLNSVQDTDPPVLDLNF
jgi:hypothetical protein